MESNRFEVFTLTLSSRRMALGGLLGGVVVLLGMAEPEEAATHNFLSRCRRIKNSPRRRACLKRARAHTATHRTPPRRPNAACVVSPITSSYQFYAAERIAQTFTEPNGGHLAAVQVVVVNALSTTGDYVLQVNTVDPSTGVPTNNTIASAQLPSGQVSTSPTLVTFFFAAPPTLVAGRQYALVLSRPDGTSYHLVPLRDRGPCSGGAAFHSKTLTGSFFPRSGFPDISGDSDIDYVTFVGP